MKFHRIILFAMALAVSCTTADTVEYTQTKETDAPLLNSVSSINSSAPSYYDIRFTIEGLLKNQKYKLTGNAQLDAANNLICLSLTDFIFKSPISTIFSSNEGIIMYLQSEKKLFKYAKGSLDLKSLWNISLDYELILALASCKIPLIADHKIKESVISTDGKTSYLILENKDYYETISFKNNIPDKIKIMDKTDKSETDFHLSAPKKYNESLIYRKISVISKRFSLDISINSIKANSPVKVKTINDIKIPMDVLSISK